MRTKHTMMAVCAILTIFCHTVSVCADDSGSQKEELSVWEILGGIAALGLGAWMASESTSLHAELAAKELQQQKAKLIGGNIIDFNSYAEGDALYMKFTVNGEVKQIAEGFPVFVCKQFEGDRFFTSKGMIVVGLFESGNSVQSRLNVEKKDCSPPQDYKSKEAFEWYLRFAKYDKNADSQNMVGLRYHEGWGVDRNYGKAVVWYSRAADQGDKWAQYNLGDCYLRGHGVSRNDGKAEHWFRKSAAQGVEDAQKALDAMRKPAEDAEGQGG